MANSFRFWCSTRLLKSYKKWSTWSGKLCTGRSRSTSHRTYKGGGGGGRISMIQTVFIFFRECGKKIPIIVVSQSFFLFCITRFSAAGGTLFLTLKIGLNTKTRNATSRLVLFFGVQLGLWRSDTGNSPTHFNSWWLIIVADGVGYNDWLGCRRPSWTPKMKPNGYGLRTVWFRFWCSILDFWFRKECPT